MKVSSLAGKSSKAKTTMSKVGSALSKIGNLSKKNNKPTQPTQPTQQTQPDNTEQIRRLEQHVSELKGQIADLEKKKGICKTIIARLNTAIGQLNAAKGSASDIQTSLMDALGGEMAKNSFNTLDNMSSEIGQNVGLLNADVATVQGKEKEIDAELVTVKENLSGIESYLSNLKA